jgi:tartrate dehydrogenase/decarboxylase/D-malate dehydrogenase
MLDHLGEHDAAEVLLTALATVCCKGPRTRDVGGDATTEEVGDAVAAAVAATARR